LNGHFLLTDSVPLNYEHVLLGIQANPIPHPRKPVGSTPQAFPSQRVAIADDFSDASPFSTQRGAGTDESR
jgi:hypothetical protein